MSQAWNKVPAAHRLAKQLAEIKSGGPRGQRALSHNYDSSFDMKARNRQAFVGLIEAALVKVRSFLRLVWFSFGLFGCAACDREGCRWCCLASWV